jgi:hypothetical protein
MGEGGVKMGAHCRISGPLKEHELYSSIFTVAFTL